MTKLEKQKLIKLGATPDEIKELEKEELIKLGATPDEIKELLNEKELDRAYGKVTPEQIAIKEYEDSMASKIAADRKRPIGPSGGSGLKSAIKNTAVDFFPNTYESLMSQDDLKRNAGAVALDLTSFGRIPASLPSAGKRALRNTARTVANVFRDDEHDVPLGKSAIETMSEGMRDTEGKNIVGKIVRSPSTGAAILTSIPSFGTTLPATMATIGLSSLAGAGNQQLKNYVKHEKLDPVEFSKDIAFGIGGGGAGVALGKGVAVASSTAVKPLASLLATRRANKLIEAIKPSEKEIADGVTKSTLKKFNIVDDNTEDALKTATKIYDDNVNNINKIVENEFRLPRYQEYIKSMSAKGKEVEFAPAYRFKPIIDKQRKAMTPGFKQEQKVALDDIQGRIKELTKGRKLKATDVEKAKDIINKVSSKHPEAVDLLKGITQELDDKVVKSYSNVITPDKRKLIKESYDIVQEVRPVKNALENTIKRGGKVEEAGPVTKTLGRIFSAGNVGREFVSSLVLPTPGYSTSAIIADETASSLAPKIMNSARKTVLKNKYETFAKKGPDISELDPLYKRFESDPEMLKELRGNRYQGKVPPRISNEQADVIEKIIGRKFNVIKIGDKHLRDINLTTNEEKLIYDLLLGKQFAKESAKNYKRIGTMGNIAGQTDIADSGITKSGRGIKGAAKTTLLNLGNMK